MAAQARKSPPFRAEHIGSFVRPEGLLSAARARKAGTITDEAFREADVVVEDTFHFGRHTGVCLEGRAILADYNAAEHSLTVYHATQAPHMMQDIFSRHLNIPEGNVRVIAKDVGEDLEAAAREH